MSGVPVNIGQGAVRSIYRNTCPTPIAPVNPISLVWTAINGGVASFNFQSIVPTSIGGIQGAYIDNSACVLSVTVTDTLGNEYTVPAGWQAMLPMPYTQGGTVTVGIAYAVQGLVSTDTEAGAMTTNVEFLNEQIPNMGMWPAARPAGIFTSGGSEWPCVVAEDTYDTTISGTVSYNTATAVQFSSSPGNAAILIEQILGGVIYPDVATEQGSTGFYGSIVLYMSKAGNSVPVGNESPGFRIPINIAPAQPVGATLVTPAPFRLISDTENLIGAGAVTINATATDNLDETGIFPEMSYAINVRVRAIL